MTADNPDGTLIVTLKTGAPDRHQMPRLTAIEQIRAFDRGLNIGDATDEAMWGHDRGNILSVTWTIKP